MIFKAHILSYIEYRSPAFFHASNSVLHLLDHLQDKFLNDIGISVKDSLLFFNLAPLAIRRDIAALGIIHRAVLRQGPSQLQSFFVRDPTPSSYQTRLGKRRHYLQILDSYSSVHKDYLDRSVLGYIWIYNLLPSTVVEARSIKTFQQQLHVILKDLASSDYKNWESLFFS